LLCCKVASGSQIGVPNRGPKSGSQIGVPNRGTKSGSQIGVPNLSPVLGSKSFPIGNKNVEHKKCDILCHQSNYITYILQMQVKNAIAVECLFITVSSPKYSRSAVIYLYYNLANIFSRPTRIKIRCEITKCKKN
jgi:hypothetical protein